ncbi:MAG: terminase small subunit, partial [Thiohalocapsa sp.]
MARKLTLKQQRFVDEYMVDLNATQAAIRAGYSPRTAEVYAWQLLQKPLVQTAVNDAVARRSTRTQIKADDVLREIARLAFSDIRGLFDEKGNLKPIHELPDDATAALSSFDVVTRRIPGGEAAEVEYVAKVKLWDKRGSLELLGKHLKLFTDKIDVGGQEDTGQTRHAPTPALPSTKIDGSHSIDVAYRHALRGCGLCWLVRGTWSATLARG